MAITYFDSASSPADGGTQTGPGPRAVTPPASMVAGDLAIIVAAMRVRNQPLTISETGGQTWNTMANGTGAPNVRIFWCRFNGTWAADPSVVEVADTAGFSVVMHVYRPTSGSYTWAVDVTEDEDTFTAPSSPFTVTRTGITTLHDSAFALAVWATADDNTWGSLSGTGWGTPGLAQYRNLAGADMSLTFAHKPMPAIGATGNVSKNQATLGGDAGVTWIASWYEEAPSITGSATVALALGVASTGALALSGSASVPLALGVSAAGELAITASATVPLALGVAATGTLSASGITGTATVTLALGVAATGTLAITGSAAVALSLGAAATGTLALAGSASLELALAVSSTATLALSGTASVALALGASATGTLALTATATVPLALSVAATGGASPSTGSATVALALGVTATGQLAITASGGAAFTLVASATGTLALAGAATPTLALAVGASGVLAITGSGTVALTLAVGSSGTIATVTLLALSHTLAVGGRFTCTLSLSGRRALSTALASRFPVTLTP